MAFQSKVTAGLFLYLISLCGASLATHQLPPQQPLGGVDLGDSSILSHDFVGSPSPSLSKF